MPLTKDENASKPRFSRPICADFVHRLSYRIYRIVDVSRMDADLPTVMIVVCSVPYLHSKINPNCPLSIFRYRRTYEEPYEPYIFSFFFLPACCKFYSARCRRDSRLAQCIVGFVAQCHRRTFANRSTNPTTMTIRRFSRAFPIRCRCRDGTAMSGRLFDCCYSAGVAIWQAESILIYTANGK